MTLTTTIWPVDYTALNPIPLCQGLFSELEASSPSSKIKGHHYFGRVYKEHRFLDLYINRAAIEDKVQQIFAERCRVSPLKVRSYNSVNRLLVDEDIRNLKLDIAYFKKLIRLSQDLPPDCPLVDGAIDWSRAKLKNISDNDRSVIQRVSIAAENQFKVCYVLKTPKTKVIEDNLDVEVSFIASFDAKLQPEERAQLLRTPQITDRSRLMRYYNLGRLDSCLEKLDRADKLIVASSLVYQLHLIGKKIRGSYTDIKHGNILVHFTPQTAETCRIIAHFADFEMCVSIPDPQLPDSQFEEQVKAIKKLMFFTAPITRNGNFEGNSQKLMNKIHKTKNIQQLKNLYAELYTVTVKQQQFAMGCVIYEMFAKMSFEVTKEAKAELRHVDSEPETIDFQLKEIEPFVRGVVLSLLDMDKQVDLQQLSQQLLASI